MFLRMRCSIPLSLAHSSLLLSHTASNMHVYASLALPMPGNIGRNILTMSIYTVLSVGRGKVVIFAQLMLTPDTDSRSRWVTQCNPSLSNAYFSSRERR